MNLPLFATDDGDDDEVKAALVTAASYHRHQQFAHSLRWLRHAAQLAADSGRTSRSQQLHACAQQLDEHTHAPTHRGPLRPATLRAASPRRGSSPGASTHRSPYLHNQPHAAHTGGRTRIDSPTEINRQRNTLQDSNAAHETPPSMLGHATVQGPSYADAPLSSLSGPPTHDDGMLPLADHEFVIVDEPTRSSNPGINAAPASVDLSRTISTVHEPHLPPTASAPRHDDEDEDATTLTTSAPMRVAVFGVGEGPARVMPIGDAVAAPEGAVLALLIPVHASDIDKLRSAVGQRDD